MQKFEVKEYPWGGEYRPETTAWLDFKEGKGFEVRMRCEEQEIRAQYTQNDDPVYEDSCMECFLQLYPNESDSYLNFEVNANGAMHCQVGTGKYDRECLAPKGISVPVVTTQKGEGFWEVSYFIPLELIKSVYGKADLSRGTIIRGNFYKCGDETRYPHFGCWARIENETPNFHLPKYFGEITLT